MKKGIYLVIAMISMLIAMLFTSLLYNQLQLQYDELVTIRTTLLSYRIKITSTYHKTIYFEIDQPPNEIQYGDPHKYERELLQRSREKDTVNLTYRRIYSHTSGSEEYWLHGMESLTDGQIILTPADLDYDGRWNWLFSTFFVIFFLFIFFWALKKWFTRSPEEPKEKEVEIPQEPSFKEIPQKPSLKDKPFKLDKPEIIIEALRTNPQNTRAWLILGWMMAKEGKPERARECYERALKINLESHEAEALWALPTWVDLVTAEQEVALISSDLYPSQENDRITLPSWFDQEKSGPSFLSRLENYLPKIIIDLIRFFNFLFFVFAFIGWPMVIFAILIVIGDLGYIAEFFMFVTLCIIFYLLKKIEQIVSSRHWPASEAIVIGSFAMISNRKKRKYYKLRVVCAYPVDKQIFYSTVPSETTYAGSVYQSGSHSSDDDLQQKEKEYNFAKPMTLFYNPLQPDMVLDKVGRNGCLYIYLLLISPFLYFLYLIIMDIIKRW